MVIRIKSLIEHLYYFKKSEPVYFVYSMLILCSLIVINIYGVHKFLDEHKQNPNASVLLTDSKITEEKNKTLTAHAAVIVEKNKKNLYPVHIVVPSNMQQISAFTHTSSIGTAENPTIDGGIINTTDGLPVYQPTVKNINVNNEPVKTKNLSETQENKTHFADDWATSTRIKTILEKAAQTGKLDYVLNKIDQKNLPASVALLPIVESAYQDNAVSPKGAVGSWQLMPETARENGISPQSRTDFVPSTKAALNYLDQLHKEFGNWTLAFAAYNAGQRRVMQAVQKNPSANTIDQLDLPIETKNYVARLKNMSSIITRTSEDKNV